MFGLIIKPVNGVCDVDTYFSYYCTVAGRYIGWSLPEYFFVSSVYFLMSPFIFNNSVETAAPFNVVSHP